MIQLYIWMHEVCLCYTHTFKTKLPNLQAHAFGLALWSSQKHSRCGELKIATALFEAVLHVVFRRCTVLGGAVLVGKAFSQVLAAQISKVVSVLKSC